MPGCMVKHLTLLHLYVMVLIDIYVVLIKYFLSCIKSSNRAEKRGILLGKHPPYVPVGSEIVSVEIKFQQFSVLCAIYFVQECNNCLSSFN